MEDKPLTIEDCMTRWGLSRDTVTIEFKKKDSPAYRVGRQWFVELQDFLTFLKKEAAREKG